MDFPAKSPIVGIPISTTSYEEVMDVIGNRPQDRGVSVAVCNVHSVMSARRDPDLQAAIAGAEIATPDGVPIVWGLRATGHRSQQRVYGPELMRRALVESKRLGWKHYLYGSTEETLSALQVAIGEWAPDADIVGAVSPPFRELTPAEQEDVNTAIQSSGADVVWVGLGMPRQELWMHKQKENLPGVALLGVGAAFDFLAGTVKQAPEWMQRAGLEWLYRLVQEPRRLWRRYIWNNPAYVALLGWQVLRTRFGRR